MGLTLLLDAPFYEGGSTSSEVPGRFPAALAGRPYLLDTKEGSGWKHESVPLLRQQADQSDSPSDQSLNPESLWRRTTDDWVGGAGQRFRDRPESNPRRFRTSFGVDIWEDGEISLLPAVTEFEDSADTNLKMAVAGARLYISEGQVTKFCTTIGGAFTTVTGTHASAVSALVSTGFRLLIGCTDGIYRTNTGISTAEKWSDLVPAALDYVKGRVMASVGASIYNVVDDLGGAGIPYAAPAALFTHPDSNFAWVGFAGGPTSQHIYAAGFSGDKSLIYKVPLKDDGTGLDAPIVAAQLPDGEIVRSIGEYVGFLLIGTDNGVRFATASDGGDLTLGATLETGSAVRCFEGQGPYVWFGWEDYNALLTAGASALSSGLGRLSLKEFASSDNLAPAYATDLMSTVDGAVQAVVTFAGRRCFAVSAEGFFAESATVLTSLGLVRSGLIDYRIPDDKVAMYVTVHHQSGDGGSHRVGLAVDGGAEVELSTHSTQDVRFLAGEARGKSFEWAVALLRDGTDTTQGPTVQAVVLEAEPTTATVNFIYAPFLLYRTLNVMDGEVACNPKAEREFIRSLRADRRLVPYQEGPDVYSVIVADFAWTPYHFTDDQGEVEGTMLVKLKEVPL